ncbi:MAG: hypothetical protein MUQ27_11285 [Acidimicrobiia bacterium]|nr:hypothetical protein [Acidimicrobiia bacterium]
MAVTGATVVVVVAGAFVVVVGATVVVVTGGAVVVVVAGAFVVVVGAVVVVVTGGAVVVVVVDGIGAAAKRIGAASGDVLSGPPIAGATTRIESIAIDATATRDNDRGFIRALAR